MARLRQTALDPGTMPPELAAGPDHPHWRNSHEGPHADFFARSRWATTGSWWSRDNLGNSNGWWALLPPRVREAQSARARYRNLNHR